MRIRKNLISYVRLDHTLYSINYGSSIIYMYVHSEIGSLDLVSLFQFLIAIQGFRCIVQLHVCADIDARANKTVARP